MVCRARHVYLAKLAERTERYDDMVEHMKAVVALEVELTIDERNLLSVALKHALGRRLDAWRKLQMVQGSVISQGKNHEAHAKEYCSQLEFEIDQICDSVLALLEAHLIAGSTTGESSVFYLKMKADYHCHKTEYLRGEKAVEAAEHARKAYQEALELSEKELAATHPIRLGLAFNYSVFIRDVLNDSYEAGMMARTAFAVADDDLDNACEASRRDSTIIMGLLREQWILRASEQEIQK